jgi:hypothetical protein
MNFKIKPKNTIAPEDDTLSNDDFFAGFSEPVQEFPAPGPPRKEEPQPEIKQIPKPGLFDQPEGMFSELNKDVSGFLVESAVSLIAFLLAQFIAKNSDTERYILPDKETKKIKTLLAAMVPQDNPIMPNWMALVITLGTAYTPIISDAFKDRKIAEQDAEIAALKQEIQKQKIVKQTENEETN